MYRIAAAAVLSAGLVACGAGEQNSPSQEDYDDVASATAALLTDEGGELEGMADAVDLASGQPPAILTGTSTGSWSGSRGQIDYAYTLTCLNARGVELPACDLRTDEARLVLAWDGEVDTARRYALLDRDGNWTLSDLQSDQIGFDGAGTYVVNSEFMALYRPVMRSLSLDYAATYVGIVYDRALRRPVAGRIDYTVSVDRTESRQFRNVEASFDMTATVTFSPEGTATLVLDGERTYVVTLDDGAVAE